MCHTKISLILCTIYYNILISANINTSENHKNPEWLYNTVQIIQKYNYTAKSYKVITEDGYHLTIIRMPNKGPPVLLVHGIGDSSDSWVVLGPEQSLAFRLADYGYDVWLFNARGNRYSKEHSKRINRKMSWDFSFEEVGAYDLSATIDYILRKTMRKTITYIGFSQGTTTFFVLCSLKPEYNFKINHAILLAPVTWLSNMKHPLGIFISQNLNTLTSFLENLKLYNLVPFNKRVSYLNSNFCNSNSRSDFCLLEMYFSFGIKSPQKLSPDKLPLIASHIPAGLSSKSLLHYIQIMKSKRFQRYDRGLKENQKVYSSFIPPAYNVSQISVPLTMFVSEDDWYSSVKDIKILAKHLKAPYKYIVMNKNLEFSHLEFVYGTNVSSLINEPIVNILGSLSIW